MKVEYLSSMSFQRLSPLATMNEVEILMVKMSRGICWDEGTGNDLEDSMEASTITVQ